MRLFRVVIKWCGVIKQGAGFRGGTWNNDITNARVSDRNNAANDNANRNNNNGARLAKTSTSGSSGSCPTVSAPGAARVMTLFDEIISIPNLYRAAYAAARGKRYNDSVAFFNFGMERELARLHEDLATGRYRHGPYEVFRIHEPKERDISKAPFRDRVVHHAFHDVIEPFIDRKFIHDSYACRRNKGTHAAMERAHSFLRANKYCFHGDVRKYFPSIDHGILKGLLRRHIHDPRVLAVLDHIIDRANRVRTVSVPGTAAVIGLPIGNLTSQFFANLYLHELDHFVKHDLRCRYYIRYMDDFLVFGNDRFVLEKVRGLTGDFLAKRLKLSLHPDKSQVFRTAEGVKFLGFRFFQDHRRIAPQGVRRFRRRLRKFRYLLAEGLVDEAGICGSVLSWRAHSDHANASRLRARLARETAAWSELVPMILTSGSSGNCHKSLSCQEANQLDLDKPDCLMID